MMRLLLTRHITLLTLLLGLWGSAPLCAQTTTPPPTSTMPSPGIQSSAQGTSSLVTRPGPTWAELSVAERDGLSPLANIWGQLSEGQKLKWRAVVASPEFANPDHRAKLQERMTTWSQLSTSQRAQARLNFAAMHGVPAQERVRKWEAYRELPEEERKRLMQQHGRQVWGAATPIKPTSKERMATLPPPPSADVKRMDRFQPQSVDPATLLPK